MRMLAFMVAILSCCISAGNLHARSLPFEDITGSVSLNRYMDYLIDPSGDLSIDDVSAQDGPRFKALAGKDPNFGYTSDVFWFRFRLSGIAAPSDQLVIQIRYALIDELILYVPQSGGNFTSKKTGRNFPMSTWEIKNRLPGFLIRPEPLLNDQYIYIRARTSSSSQFPMSIMHLLEYSNRDHDIQLANALYFGAMVIMAIYNLIFWVMTRQAKYGFYVIFVASSCLLVMSIMGYNFEYLWPSAIAFNKISVNLIMGMVTVSIAFFYVTSFNIFQHKPRLRLCTYVVGYAGIPTALLFLVLPYALSIKISMGIMLFGAIYFIALSIYFSWLRYRTAYFFMLAFKALLLGTIIYILKTFAFLPSNFLTELAPQFGSAVQVALLSFALADQFREVKKEKEAAQKRLLAFQDEHIRTLDAKVEAKTREIRSILATIKQGIFTLGGDGLTINPDFSDYLKTIVQTDAIAGQNAMDLLFQGSHIPIDVVSQMKSALNAVMHEDEISFLANSSLLVLEYSRQIHGQTQHLQVDWAPILDERAQVGKILVTLRDVTAMKALEQQSEDKSREMQIITEILGNAPDKFARFMKKAKQYLDTALKAAQGHASEADLQQIFILMHTLKGDARALGLGLVSSRIHELEDAIKWRQKQPAQTDLGLIQEIRKTLALIQDIERIEKDKLGRSPGFSGRVVSGETMLEILQSFQKIRENLPLHESAAHFRNTRTLLYEACYESLHEFLGDVTKPVASMARYLEKAEPEVIVTSERDLYIRSEHREDLANAFLHLLRNSLDHGLETPAQRLSQGKRAQGRLAIACRMMDGDILLSYEDDGKGLDLDMILQKAVAKGLIPVDQNLAPQDIAELIFLPGFSTMDVANDISGRGVGMSAARAFVEGLGGTLSIELQSRPEPRALPFRFIIRLPQSRLELAA